MKLIHGDCLAAMAELPAASVDSIVTDPPYELGFMGKHWDGTGIAYNVETWRQALRVLKPGGHLLAFSGSRTYHRMACAIEDAGFEIRDQIMWLYGSGFPKSHDVSKGVDRMGGQPWSEFAALLDRLIKAAGYNYTTLDRALGIPSAGSNSCYWVRADERGGLPPRHYYEALKALLSPPTIFTDLYDKAEREVIGIDSRKNAPSGIVSAGRVSVDVDREITAPATDAARQWQGWGTALKPAHEPIVLARKPLEGTVAANVLKHGTGALNVDGCRVATDETAAIGSPSWGGPMKRLSAAPGQEGKLVPRTPPANNGRWPANVIHDGSDDVVGAFPQASGQQGAVNGLEPSSKTNNVYGQFGGRPATQPRGDSGSAARFFYVAKASRKDRDCGGVKNIHATVKPTDLMRYLCRLVTPPGGTVLDPFMGSGSTGRGAVLEGFDFIGIEREAEYLAIAERRIAEAQERGKLPDLLPDLFGLQAAE